MNCFGGVLDNESQIVELEWFGKIVIGAGFDSLDSHAFGAVGRNDDHERAVAVCGLDFAQEIKTAHAGKVYIEEKQVRFVLFEQGASRFSGTGFSNVVTKSSEGAPHAVARGFLVVNNHQSQRVFSHFLSSLGPCGPKLLARCVPQLFRGSLGGDHQDNSVAGWSNVERSDDHRFAFAHADVSRETRGFVIESRCDSAVGCQ